MPLMWVKLLSPHESDCAVMGRGEVTSLAREGLRISTAERRRSSELPGAVFWPVSHTLGTLGNLRETLAPAGS